MNIEPQINVLRLNYTVKDCGDYYDIDGKVHVFKVLGIMRDAAKPTRQLAFKPKSLLHRLPRFMQGKEHLFSLVYVIGDKETVEVLDKPRAICEAVKKKLQMAGTHKIGVLQII